MLVDALMRYIYDQKQGINLMIVTQSEDVADELCKLNKWQKIAPLDGLSIPTRQQVRQKEADMPEKTVWDTKALQWSLQNLTKFIDSRFKDNTFQKGGQNDENEQGIITWLKPGMTPTDAEIEAERIIEDDKTKKNPGTAEDDFATTL